MGLLEHAQLQAIRTTLAALPAVDEADEWEDDRAYVLATARRLLAHIDAMQAQPQPQS